MFLKNRDVTEWAQETATVKCLVFITTFKSCSLSVVLNRQLVSVMCFSPQIIVDDDDSKVWSLYDAGPKSVRCPIIFLPPVSGTAEVFFQQVLALTGWGYRVISVSKPGGLLCAATLHMIVCLKFLWQFFE